MVVVDPETVPGSVGVKWGYAFDGRRTSYFSEKKKKNEECSRLSKVHFSGLLKNNENAFIRGLVVDPPPLRWFVPADPVYSSFKPDCGHCCLEKN